jgi:hypothetical protein
VEGVEVWVPQVAFSNSCNNISIWIKYADQATFSDLFFGGSGSLYIRI